MGNVLLNELATHDREAVLAVSRPFRFTSAEVLYDVEMTFVDFVFIENGVVAALLPVAGGAIETGLIGPEGTIPTLLEPSPRKAYRRFQALSDGEGLRIAIPVLKRLLSERPAIRCALDRHAAYVHRRDHLGVACATLHGVRGRLARTLLRMQDRLLSDRIVITQDELGQMLGSRRTTISEAARDLQAQGIIRCARGVVMIMDRDALEAASCGCYGLLRRNLSAPAVSHLPPPPSDLRTVALGACSQGAGGD